LKRRLKRRSRPEQGDGKPSVLIFDATALSYAAFYAIGTTLSYNGKPTAVIYSFLMKVLQLARMFKTNEMVFAWDAGYSWREVNYPQYKQARREKKEEASPEEKEVFDQLLYQQIQLHTSVLPRLGFKNSFCFPKYEGDDIIGKLVKDHFKGRAKIVITSDSDMYQLLDKCDIFLLKQKKLFTNKDFQEKYGIHPDQWPLAKAIGGCSTDGVIGVQGVSDPKSPTSKALKYIRGEITSGKIYDRIKRAENECVQRNLPLVTVPYMESEMPEIKIRQNRVTRRKLIKQFDKFRFISFLEDETFSKWEEAFTNVTKKL